MTTSLVSAGVVILADVLSKLVVTGTMSIGDKFSVFPGLLSIHYIRNSGAAFGLLAGYRFLLVGVPLVAVVLFLWYARGARQRVERVAWGLMIGGAVGNWIDRVISGSVVDMIRIEPLVSVFRVFNVADLALNTGVVLLLGYYWTARRAAPGSGIRA